MDQYARKSVAWKLFFDNSGVRYQYNMSSGLWGTWKIHLWSYVILFYYESKERKIGTPQRPLTAKLHKHKNKG
jgi:hypothetical protein